MRVAWTAFRGGSCCGARTSEAFGKPRSASTTPLTSRIVPRGKAVDLDLLHEYLWKRSDRLGRLTIVQKDFAEEVGVTKFTLCLIFGRLTDEGRIKKIQAHQSNYGTYQIRDPRNWE